MAVNAAETSSCRRVVRVVLFVEGMVGVLDLAMDVS
jgi:hypothetical protein